VPISRDKKRSVKDLLAKSGLTGLKINLGFLEADWKPEAKDRAAAWELYVELLTRIATQPLAEGQGDEKTALDSVFSLFGITREILRRNGPDCIQFTKIAVIVLNQIVRPFTAKWHRLSVAGAFADPERCAEFRSELVALQRNLLRYARLLADVADVEDLTGAAFFEQAY
jgi:hypothetical protein